MSAVERIGFTGHQGLTARTERDVRAEIARELSAFEIVEGVSSLAEGADQIFSELIVEIGGRLKVVIPSEAYETTFDKEGLRKYRQLLKIASSVIKLDYSEPNEDAFWAAGKYVVDNSDRVIAVWNGMPAGGLGGTADVVSYAREQGKPVTVIWPVNAERT